MGFLLTPEQEAALRRLSTETLGECDPAVQVLDRRIRYIGGGKLVGIAHLSVIHPGDNLGAHEALYRAEPGQVLVYDANWYADSGFWGEIMTAAAVQRGLKGLVTNGAVRDVPCYDNYRFPAFAQGVCIRGTTKLHHAAYPSSLVFGNAVIHQNDVIVGDEDGIVAFRPEHVERVIAAAIARDLKEQVILQRIRNGESTIDIYSLGGQKS